MAISQISLNFPNDQKTFRIGNVKIGGQPGERPMVLIGSIFFAGHNIVQDQLKGIFDADKAKALLDQEEAISAATGMSRIIDVIGETPEALIRYIDFVAQHTSSPILVDSPSQQARMAAIRHFSGSQVMPRLVYNSIAEDYTEEELACLKNNGVEHAVVLAFSTRAMKTGGKASSFSQVPCSRPPKGAGVNNLIIDLGIMDVPSVSWVSSGHKRGKGEARLSLRLCPPQIQFIPGPKMKGQRRSGIPGRSRGRIFL